MTHSRSWSDFTLARLPAFAALGVGAGLLCYGSSLFFEGTPGVTAFWPTNALVLAFVLRVCRTQFERRLALAVTLAAMVAVNFITGRAWDVSLAFAFANVAEIAVAAWFMRQIAMPLCGLRDLRQFLLGAVLAGPLASTLIAALFMFARLGVSGEALAAQAGVWLLADMMGMAVVAPFALSLGSVGRGGWLRALAGPTAIGVICFLLCWQTQLPVAFMAFPMVAWTALNDRDRGAALGVGAIAIAVIGAALLGEGPVARMPRFGVDPGLVVPVFFGALVLTAFPLAALLKELDVLAQALDRRRAAAEDDSAAKSELIGRVGEELRSPLTGVVTVAEMLRSGRLGDLNDRQRDLLARIAESGAEIESLSREMVALADGGRLAERAAPVAEVVDEAVASARFRANRARVSLLALAGEPHWRADIDADRLKRLLQDALSAAVDAAPPETTVRVVVGLTADGALDLTVEDAGAGALAERQARFAAMQLMPPASDGVAFDRSELRRQGGDLRFGPGELGGGRLTLVLPRVADAATVRAA
jgi:signal transduction histidine kinase